MNLADAMTVRPDRICRRVGRTVIRKGAVIG